MAARGCGKDSRLGEQSSPQYSFLLCTLHTLEVHLPTPGQTHFSPYITLSLTFSGNCCSGFNASQNLTSSICHSANWPLETGLTPILWHSPLSHPNELLCFVFSSPSLDCCSTLQSWFTCLSKSFTSARAPPTS